jgi:hypothetical protein
LEQTLRQAKEEGQGKESMGKIFENAIELIGHTPLMKVSNFARENNVTDATLLAKLEYLNPPAA